MEYTIQGKKGILGKMVSYCQSAMFTLRDKDIFELDGSRGNARTQCIDGILWINQKDDPEDHFIKKGQTFTVTRHGKVLIQGIPDARARIYKY
jgi:hypothetical protein